MKKVIEFLRKFLFIVTEAVAIISFIMLASISDETHIKYIVGLFVIFLVSAVLAVFIDSPRRIIRVVLPAMFCVFAFIHMLLKPIVKLFSGCYKVMKREGGFAELYYFTQDAYDNKTVNFQEYVVNR